MKLRLSLAALACASLVSTTTQAAEIFYQNFTEGLGANESVGGAFQVTKFQMGHAGSYENREYSFYQVALDLTDFTDATLMFDYDMVTEWHYDGFNVLASTDAVFDHTTELLTPITSGFYNSMGNNLSKLGKTAFSGEQKGTVMFDLSQFAGQSVNLRFQFQSDFAAPKRGVLLDNILVNGNPVSAVPEPATWAMMIVGFFGAGTALRQRRRQLAHLA